MNVLLLFNSSTKKFCDQFMLSSEKKRKKISKIILLFKDFLYTCEFS